jgi:hypothetical protein
LDNTYFWVATNNDDIYQLKINATNIISLDVAIPNTKDIQTISFYSNNCSSPFYNNILFGIIGSYTFNVGTYPFSFNRNTNTITYTGQKLSYESTTASVGVVAISLDLTQIIVGGDRKLFKAKYECAYGLYYNSSGFCVSCDYKCSGCYTNTPTGCCNCISSFRNFSNTCSC